MSVCDKCIHKEVCVYVEMAGSPDDFPDEERECVHYSECRPTGEWDYSCQNGWHCSICQQIVKDMPIVMGKANFDYCPNCGVKMKKEKEND